MSASLHDKVLTFDLGSSEISLSSAGFHSPGVVRRSLVTLAGSEADFFILVSVITCRGILSPESYDNCIFCSSFPLR